MPFAGSPLTAESPEGDFALLAATSVAGQPGDAQHEFALGFESVIALQPFHSSPFYPLTHRHSRQERQAVRSRRGLIYDDARTHGRVARNGLTRRVVAG